MCDHSLIKPPAFFPPPKRPHKHNMTAGDRVRYSSVSRSPAVVITGREATLSTFQEVPQAGKAGLPSVPQSCRTRHWLHPSTLSRARRCRSRFLLQADSVKATSHKTDHRRGEARRIAERAHDRLGADADAGMHDAAVAARDSKPAGCDTRQQTPRRQRREVVVQAMRADRSGDKCHVTRCLVWYARLGSVRLAAPIEYRTVLLLLSLPRQAVQPMCRPCAVPRRNP